MKRIFLSLLFSSVLVAASANNISISNVSLTGQNVTAGTNSTSNFTLVQFSVSWENSHRIGYGPTNWDAAWIFIKYRVNGGTWEHARLNSTGHTAPVGSTITTGLLTPTTAFNTTTNPGLGAFIYRNGAGTGTFTATTAQLRWNYGASAIADNAVVEVSVYGIEMIYVSQGAFNAGGGGGTGSFTSTTVNSASALTVPSGTGTLGGQAGGYPTGQTAPTSASWPNGFAAFYCMKHEISQQQYVDFLNNLTSAQATPRFLTSNSNRYAVTVNSGVYSTTNPSVAMNFLGWADLESYLDWSGLRPMTELEYEKACRGTLSPVSGEYAWGTTSITGVATLTNAGLASEVSATIAANANFNATLTNQGPVRVGMFAGATTTRAQAGASYYGIMEMAGNLWERVVTLASTEGKAFTGTHGDGSISTLGDHNTISWPAITGLGSRLRGGAFNTANTFLYVSDRNDFGDVTARSLNTGGRGVRTAP